MSSTRATDAGAAVEVPEDGPFGHDALLGGIAAATGQPPVVTTAPSAGDQPGGDAVGRPARPAPAGPSTTAAVLAVLAATQVGRWRSPCARPRRPAAPVRGSSRWWRTAPPRRPAPDPGARGGEPAGAQVDQLRGARGRPGRSDDRDRPRLAVGCGDPEVAAQADQRRLARARARSRRRPGRRPTPCRGAEVERGAGRDPDRARPGRARCARQASVPGPGTAPGVGPACSTARAQQVGSRGRSRAAPAAGRAAGGPARRSRGGLARDVDGGDQQRVDLDPAARRRLTRLRSESARNRLHVASTSSTTARARRSGGAERDRAAYGEEQVGPERLEVGRAVAHAGHDPLLGAGGCRRRVRAPAREPERAPAPDDPEEPGGCRTRPTSAERRGDGAAGPGADGCSTAAAVT